MLKTLFLSPPSVGGFDGSAGARCQAKREVTSHWFPTWFAQPAALVKGSKLMDAPPHRQTMEDVPAIANDYELFVLHISTPSLKNDVARAEAIKAKNPHVRVGLSRRDGEGRIHHNPERELIHDWDAMPSVLPVYDRDLKIENYFIGHLPHPYFSFYTGRWCPAKCSFCLWPQTVVLPSVSSLS